MTGMLLSCLLGLSPGVVLADGSPSHRKVHLVEPLFRLASYETEAGLSRMNRDQLIDELNRLEKPSFTVPIILLCLGAGVGITGAVLVAIGGDVIGYGILFVAGGIVVAIVGGIMLGIRFARSSEYNAKAEAIQRHLDMVEQAPGGKPEELQPPPPPPPPPPSAGAWPALRGTVVAVF